MTESTEMATPSKWDELKRLTIKYWPPVVMILITTVAWLMYGGDSAPVNLPAVEAPAVETVVVEAPAAPAVDAVEAPAAPAVDIDVNSEGFFAFVDEGNFWLAMTIILAIILVANLLSHLKKPVAAGAAAGTLPAPYFRSSIVWFIAAVLMVLIGLWGIYPTFFGENNQDSEIFGDLGLFGVIAVGVIAITLVVGAVKYMGIAGNASAYFFMVVWVLLLFFGIIYLLGGWLAPDATTAIIDAVKNDAASAAAGIVETTNGKTSVKWDALFDKDTWLSIAIVAILTLAPVVVFHQYISKNKLVVVPVALVAMTIFFGTVYKILIEYEPAREVIEDVSGALGAANETVNPFLGERHTHNLSGLSSGEAQTIIDVGPYDDIKVSMPMKVCRFASPDGIMPTSGWLARFGNEPWFDSDAFLKRTNSNPNIRTYELSETMKEGMKDADTTVDITFTLTCEQ